MTMKLTPPSQLHQRPRFGPRRKFFQTRSRHAAFITTALAISLLIVPQLPLRAGETNNNNVREDGGKKRVFDFEGGSPIDFIVALDRHFRTRLVQILTLPETLSRTRVPKLRVAADDPREVLTLYNRIQSPGLGQWKFEPESIQKPDGTNMNVLMLVPDKNGAPATIVRTGARVKGVALAGVPEKNWQTLVRDIEEARKYGEDLAARGDGDSFTGTIRIQHDSKILIVAGSPAYMDMVESLVQAHRENASLEANAAVSKKPEPATK